MGVIIRFPNCRPLTKLEYREKLRAWYNNPHTWLRSAKGHPYCWLGRSMKGADEYWVQVYQRVGGGWSWGIGKRAPNEWESPTWSPKTYETFEIAKRKAWVGALARVEWDRDEALGLHDDGDAA